METNRARLYPASDQGNSESAQNEGLYSQIDGLLVIHIRRGDFVEHCENLGHWGAAFLAFNQFPEFLDLWEPPQGSEEHKMAVYLRRCIPTFQQIVDKVEQVRRTDVAKGLKNVYIMTNADHVWLMALKGALLEAYDEWGNITSSRDMVLTWEEKYVAHAADMLIGQRAQVFIGNGVSTIKFYQARRAHPNISSFRVSLRMWLCYARPEVSLRRVQGCGNSKKDYQCDAWVTVYLEGFTHNFSTFISLYSHLYIGEEVILLLLVLKSYDNCNRISQCLNVDISPQPCLVRTHSIIESRRGHHDSSCCECNASGNSHLSRFALNSGIFGV